MGARITLTDGHAPLTIEGAALKAIDYTTPVPSAQVKTCVLLAGLQTAGTTTVREAVRTRDHSELALRAFGAEVARSGDSVSIAGPQKLHAIEAAVPGDISSAAFFFCAAASVSGLVAGAGLDRPESHARRAARCAHRAGRAHCRAEPGREACRAGGHGSGVGAADGLRSTAITGSLAAQLIDELPVLAAIGPYTSGGIRIRDAKELR